MGAEKPYALLTRAMASTRRVGIGRFVMRGKQYLATIRPMGDLLALETMHFADEIRGVDDVENAPVDAEPADREMDMAEQLIGASQDGLADPSKEELYERASEAGVHGRSKMTKRELVDALRSHVVPCDVAFGECACLLVPPDQG